MLDPTLIAEENQAFTVDHRRDYEHLGQQLRRRKIDVERIVAQAAAFAVAVPSWALGTGGTRFGRFAGPGQPRDVFEKMDDIAVVHQLTGAAPRV